MVRLGFVCLALAACTASPNTDFAELPGLHVDVLLNREIDRDTDAKRPSSVTVTLYYDEAAFDALDSGRTCATIVGSGTFNGVELELAQQGEYFELECIPPHFSGSLQLSPQDLGHLELRDHQGNEIVAELPAGGVRMATSANGWTFTSGQQVTLDWSNPTDLTEVSPADVAVFFNRGDGNAFPMTVESVVSPQLVFTVPSPPPLLGDGLIDVILPSSHDVVEATSCRGAVKCTLSAVRAYQHSVRIERAP